MPQVNEFFVSPELKDRLTTTLKRLHDDGTPRYADAMAIVIDAGLAALEPVPATPQEDSHGQDQAQDPAA